VDIAFIHTTETGEEGTLTADTPVELVASATDLDTIVAADDVLTLNLNEDGTATLPAGTGVIEGRYVD